MDSYTIIGNTDVLINDVDKTAPERGYENVGYYSTLMGKSAEKQFYSLVSADYIKKNYSAAGFSSYADALQFTLEHENGHPKFRFHPYNAKINPGMYDDPYNERGTGGHVEGTIMWNNAKTTNYDYYMSEMLKQIHGTVRAEPSQPENVINDENGQTGEQIIRNDHRQLQKERTDK